MGLVVKIATEGFYAPNASAFIRIGKILKIIKSYKKNLYNKLTKETCGCGCGCGLMI